MALDWQRVKQVFAEVHELPATRRLARLDELCQDEDELRVEVEALLESHDEVGSFLRQPVLRRPRGERPSEVEELAAADRRIGHYDLVRQLGRGGMGEVYLARRADDEFHKEVAIKLVRRSLDHQEAFRRFRTERQVLASLEHPNIAHLIDGGTTSGGQPYLVMEYVDGRPIDEYCDQRKLNVHQRLELVRTVCLAVHVAHQNLIIHRDIKPTNILVTQEGIPKLLDFGIAKVLATSSEDATLSMTAEGSFLMTPQYASPEQMSGERVTTASDVYSLGVLLYVLLTGQRPYELTGLVPAKAAEVVCLRKPDRPSTVVASAEPDSSRDGQALARARSTEPRRLRRQLAGDIDTLVGMALRKDPSRRYSSVEQLGADLGRYLQGLPIQARKDTVGYRLGKFVRRNKAMSLAAVIFVVFAFDMTRQRFKVASERDRAEIQHQRAEKQRSRAERTANFLVDLLQESDPSEAKGAEVTVKEVLERSSQRLDLELHEDPETRALLMDTIGKIYYALGSYDKAEVLLEGALDLRRSLHDFDHQKLAESYNNMATLRLRQERYEAAVELYRLALEEYQQSLGPAHPDVATVQGNLGSLLYRLGDYDAAEPIMWEAFELQTRFLGEGHPRVLLVLGNLGRLHFQRGEFQEAERLLRQAIDCGSAVSGRDDPTTISNLQTLARVLRQKPDFEGAIAVYREVLERRKRVLGEAHPHVANTMSSLALVLRYRGDHEEAEEMYRQALGLVRQAYGAGHPEEAKSLVALASLLIDQRRLAEAEVLASKALEIARSRLPENHIDLGHSLQGLGQVYLEQGRSLEAESLLLEALEIRRQRLPEDHWRIAVVESLLGINCLQRERWNEARQWLEHGYPILLEVRGAEMPETRRAGQALKELELKLTP